MADEPIIPWDNQLANPVVAYTVEDGADGTGSPLTEAWTYDALRLAIPKADASGDFTVLFTITPEYGFGEGPFGGGYFGGFGLPRSIILGAHQHDSEGFRFSGGSIRVAVNTASGYVDILSTTAIVAGTNEPAYHALDEHEPLADGSGNFNYRVYITGLTASTDFVLPEMFLGPVLTMPRMNYGFDDEEEEWTGPRLISETGRIYESSLSRRHVAKPVFNAIAPAQASEIDWFRERHLEERLPFWWFWLPDTKPAEGYFMRHSVKRAPMPHYSFELRRITLDMIEHV